MQRSVFKFSSRLLIIATSAFMLSSQAIAQAPESSSAGNAYRAEIVILERKVAPEDVIEQMAGRNVEPTPQLPAQMLVKDQAGVGHSTLQLVPKNEMHLSSAANRLVNSGRFRVLMTAAWYQSFPPNYKGQPMQVAIGDWLPSAGLRNVEGTITIDRERYLHVQVELNHWLDANNMAMPQSAPMTATPQGSVAEMAQGGEMAAAGDTGFASQPQPELLTWIRETRRMRSEEIHFLDSPTIGVLVFFRKIGG